MKPMKYMYILAILLLLLSKTSLLAGALQEPFGGCDDSGTNSGENSGNGGGFSTRAFPWDSDDTEGINLDDPDNPTQKYLPLGNIFPLCVFAGGYGVVLYVRKKRLLNL